MALLHAFQSRNLGHLDAKLVFYLAEDTYTALPINLNRWEMNWNEKWKVFSPLWQLACLYLRQSTSQGLRSCPLSSTPSPLFWKIHQYFPMDSISFSKAWEQLGEGGWEFSPAWIMIHTNQPVSSQQLQPPLAQAAPSSVRRYPQGHYFSSSEVSRMEINLWAVTFSLLIDKLVVGCGGIWDEKWQGMLPNQSVVPPGMPVLFCCSCE